MCDIYASTIHDKKAKNLIQNIINIEYCLKDILSNHKCKGENKIGITKRKCCICYVVGAADRIGKVQV